MKQLNITLKRQKTGDSGMINLNSINKENYYKTNNIDCINNIPLD